MNRRLTSAVLGGALAAAMTFSGGASVGAADIELEVDGNGLAALLDAFDDLDLAILDNGEVEVIEVELENSLNNLQALNNVLNNNDVLNDIEVDIQDVEVLTDNQIEILEQADIDIDDVIGVDVLDGGDFLVFVD
ncbi:MAG: hypothetical protein M3Q03_10910 [Chloroflexota bacterium]|nr:hypothetical protein [Chloroflexota bacterium]